MLKNKRLKPLYAVLLIVCFIVSVCISLAVFTDRVEHKMNFTTAKFTAEGYSLERVAPDGPFVAGEDVAVTIKESNADDSAVRSVITMTTKWTSPDTLLSIFGNAEANDNATITIDGKEVSYTVNDDGTITYVLPEHILSSGAKDQSRDLVLHIPESFKSTGEISFTFDKVALNEHPYGFSKEFSHEDLNKKETLDFAVKVGWAASNLSDTDSTPNGHKALMGYLTEKDSNDMYGIEFKLEFKYDESAMKDFASKTDAKWSYYKDTVNRLEFIEGMTSIGDYAFPDFENVTSIELPESITSVGTWAFDNTSLAELTLPEKVAALETMSFGHINELIQITFNQGENKEIAFPDAGEETGAFFVSPYAEPTNRTKIVAENTDALEYDWVADQRKLLPIMRSWDHDATSDFHGLRDQVSTISFTDSYELPDGFDTSEGFGPWDVSEEQDQSVMAYMLPNDSASQYEESYFMDADLLPNGRNTRGTLVSKVTWDGSKYTWSDTDVVATDFLVSEWYDGDYSTRRNRFVLESDTSSYYTVASTSGTLNKNVCAGGYDVIICSNTGWTENVIANEDSDYICNYMLGLTAFSSEKLDTDNITSLRQTFDNCKHLIDLDISNFDTKNVKNFYGMFNMCESLESINVTFDVSGVNDAQLDKQVDLLISLGTDEDTNGISGGLAHMFSGCAELTAMDTSGWDTSGAHSLMGTFNDCHKITTLDVSDWDVSKVKNFKDTFQGMYIVEALDVSDWDTGSAENMYSMFEDCGEVKTLAVGDWDVSKVKDFTCAFENCYSMTTLDVSKWDTSSAEDMTSMFWCCENLEALDVSGWDVSKVTSFYFTFADCPKLTEMAVGKWDTSKVRTFYYMFSGCEGLTSIDVATKVVNKGKSNEYVAWDTSHAYSIAFMFSYCFNLEEIDVSGWVVTGSGTIATGEPKPYFSTELAFAGTKIPEITLGPGWDCLNNTLYGMGYLKDITFEHGKGDSLALEGDTGKWYGLAYVGKDGTYIKSSPYNENNLMKTTIHVECKEIKDIVLGYNWVEDFRDVSVLMTPVSLEVVTPPTKTSYKPGDNFDPTGMQILVTYKDGSTADVTSSVTLSDNEALKDGQISIPVTYTENGVTVSATITITVASPPPMLAASTTWYKGSTKKNTLTAINIVDSADAETIATATESWPAAADQDGDGTNDSDYMCYVNGTTLTIAGDGSGKIMANPKSSSAMYEFSKTTIINGLELLDTSNVTNMNSMFSRCSALTSLDLSSFDTSNVADMNNMFYSCSALTSLDLSNWNTAKVTDMSEMFLLCSALTSIDLSHFDTSNVTRMSSMFNECSRLKTINLSNWNTAKVTDMRYMFYSCSALTSLDLSNWNNTKVTDMSNMFSYCKALTSLDLSNWNNTKVTDMSNMFSYCKALTSLDLSSFGTSNVNNMSWMFSNCSALTSLDLSNWNTAKVTDMRFMFYSCSALTSLDLSSFDTSNVTNMNSMFSNCSVLTSLDLSSFDTSNVADMHNMFYGCSSLKSLILSNWNTAKVTDMSGMFYSCKALTSIDLSSFDTSNVTNMSNMFSYCSALTSIDLSSFDTSNVTNFNAFSYLTILKTVILGDKFGTTSIYGSGLFKKSNNASSNQTNLTVYGANEVMKAYDWAADGYNVTFKTALTLNVNSNGSVDGFTVDK